MPSLAEFLGARGVSEGEWRFDVPIELHGAFGGAFGGIVAACTLIAARSVVPGRVPNALDCRFVRGLPAGSALARATVLHSGRSLSTITVDLSDESDRLCTRSTISLIDRAVLHEFSRPGPRPGDWKPHSEATPWPALAPIVTTIDSRIVGTDERGIATAMKVPWDVTPESSAESACMAADMAVGPPIGGALPQGVSGPNPDLSLRFCGEVTTPILVGVGRLERAGGGVAAARLEVWSADEVVAIGIATSLMIPLT
jgi:acyl-coenzyme A thioesterase PaaI-like protein